MSIYSGLFYAETFGNCVHGTFTFVVISENGGSPSNAIQCHTKVISFFGAGVSYSSAGDLISIF